MIVFILHLHMCTTQPMMRGGALGQTVTACSDQVSGGPLATQAACDSKGRSAIGTIAGDDGMVRKVDAYQCQSVPVGS